MTHIGTLRDGETSVHDTARSFDRSIECRAFITESVQAPQLDVPQPVQLAAAAAAREAKVIKRLLRRLLYGGSTSLRAYEIACLNCLRSALRPEARIILDSQVESIEIIQRFSRDKLVTLYPAERLRNVMPLFPNKRSELYVAKLPIFESSGRTSFCKFVFHKGQFSSLEFSESPGGIDFDRLRCRHIEMLEDLMVSPPSSDGVAAGRMLSVIGADEALRNVVPPVSQKERETFLKRFDNGVVPADYITLLEETDGFTVDSWQFTGTRSRTITLPDRTYYVVAERLDGQTALCLRGNNLSPQFVLYDEIADKEEPAGDRLQNALFKAIRATSP